MLRSTITCVLLALLLSSCMREAVNLMGDQPRDLGDCFQLLDSALGPEKVSQIRSMTEEDFATKGSFGLARWIRNNWWLWTEGDLNQTFQALGVTQTESMIDVILTSYHRYLHNRPVDIERLIERVKLNAYNVNMRKLVEFDSADITGWRARDSTRSLFPGK